jgi:hypothetical protein
LKNIFFVLGNKNFFSIFFLLERGFNCMYNHEKITSLS